MIAVEYERVFAEQAEKRMKAGVKPDPEESLPQGSPVEESLPQREDRGPQATDEAGDLFNVSGRTVRDAHKAPQWPLDRILSDFRPFPIPKYG